MSEILDSFDFGRSGTRSKYDWDELFDGKIRRLTEDDFGGSQLKYLPYRIRAIAKKRGVGVRVKMNSKEGTVTMQAYELGENGEPPAAAPKKKTAKK